MNVRIWNIPESCSEQDVRDFLQHELGHYAKEIAVYDAGTPAVYATVELNAEQPYIADVIAQQLHGKHLAGVALQASAAPFGEEPDAARDR
jgi:hypothetical protein